MASELVISLHPAFESDLDVDALIYEGDVLEKTEQLTEAPVESARYHNTGTLTLDAGIYDVRYVDRSTGEQYGVEATPFYWDGTKRVTPVDAESVRDAIGLASANLDTQLSALSSLVGDIPGDVLDKEDGVEDGYTLRQALRIMLAVLAGKLTGADTTEITIRDVNDAIDRVVATVTVDGDRLELSLDTSDAS